MDNTEHFKGELLIVERYNISQNDDSPFRHDVVELFVDGQRAGYIRSRHIPSSVFQSHFIEYPGGPYMAMAERAGNHRLKYTNTRDENFLIYHNSNNYPANMTQNDLNDQVRNEILRKLHQRYRDDFIHYLNFFVDKPFVDYVALYTKYETTEKFYPSGNWRPREAVNYRNIGLGSVLYVAMAHMMNNLQMSLRSSDLQSEHAKTIWQRLLKNFAPYIEVKKTLNSNEEEKTSYEICGLGLEYKLPAWIIKLEKISLSDQQPVEFEDIKNQHDLIEIFSKENQKIFKI